MSLVLIVFGLLLALFGAVVIVAGAPEWALGLGLGASLIESGAIGLVGGLVVFGIGLLLRAVRDLGRRLDAFKPTTAQRAPAGRVSVERAPEIEPSLVPQQIPVPPTQPVARPAHPSARPAAADEKDLHPRAWPPSTAATSRVQAEPPPRIREPAPERSARVQAEPPPRVREPAPEPAMREMPTPKPEPASKPRPPVPVTDAAPAGPAVRSGIIGGMAYTLYADGSIEADMALGVMRFASIEDLRAHVSRTGADADSEFRKPVTKS